MNHCRACTTRLPAPLERYARMPRPTAPPMHALELRRAYERRSRKSAEGVLLNPGRAPAAASADITSSRRGKRERRQYTDMSRNRVPSSRADWRTGELLRFLGARTAGTILHGRRIPVSARGRRSNAHVRRRGPPERTTGAFICWRGDTASGCRRLRFDHL